MELDAGASLGGCVLVVLVVILVAGLVLAPMLWAKLEGAQADHARAEAQRIEAQARADHIDAVDWQRSFMLWTAYLEANDLDLVLVLVVAIAALVSGWMFGRRAA